MEMLCLVLSMLVIGVVSSANLAYLPYFDSTLDASWEEFKASFSRSYFEQEEIFRRTIWESNVKLILEHNLQADMGVYSYRLGVNEYADMSTEEYRKYLTNYRPSVGDSDGAHFLPLSNFELPEEVDWRTKGYVTPVKNQGQCGSCWTFSTTGALEGQHFRATGKLVSLSEQQIVDCTESYGNQGCHGGWKDKAFQYIKDNGGVDTEKSYPYTAQDGTCHFNKSSVGATCSGFTDIPSKDERALQQAVAAVGPVSVAIDATGPFHLYKEGVYNNPNCTQNMDHAVLVVGYGTEGGHDYWLVKNSWGESWGEKGYIKMTRNDQNQCAIASQASYPLV